MIKKIEDMDISERLEHYLDHEIEKQDIAGDLLKQGHPASYTDDKGRFITHYPDGRKFLACYDEVADKCYDGEEIFD